MPFPLGTSFSTTVYVGAMLVFRRESWAETMMSGQLFLTHRNAWVYSSSVGKPTTLKVQFPKFPGELRITNSGASISWPLQQDYPGLKKVLYFPLLGLVGSPASALIQHALRTWLWLNDSDAALQLTTASGCMAGMAGKVPPRFGLGQSAKCIQMSINCSANSIHLWSPESLRNFGWSAGHLWWLCGLAGFTFVARGSPVLSCHRSFLFASPRAWA